MDYLWFRDTMRRSGVRADDVAEELGRSRTAVSKILNGKQQMTLPWAQAFAARLDVPIDVILERAGVSNAEDPPQMRLGAEQGDVRAWSGDSNHQKMAMYAKISGFGLDRDNVDAWVVQSLAMSTGGFLPGDIIIADPSKSELCKTGDTVIARIYDWEDGLFRTILRRFEPPVLAPATTDPAMNRVHVVDGKNVAIHAKVVLSWRIA